MANGFITLHRMMLEWEWADDHYMVCLWVHLLLLANHEGKKWHGMTIERGQLITDLRTLAKRTGLSIQQVRTRLDRLVESDCINKQITNKYTLITICNYDKYQDVQQTNNKQTTNKQQTNNKQITHNNNETNNNITTTTTGAYACEGSSPRWQGSDVVTGDNIPPLNDLWIEEIQRMISQQLKVKLTTEQVNEHYQDFVSQEESPYLQVLYSDWRGHFKRYVRKRIRSRQNESDKTNKQYLSRDEQRKLEAETRKQSATRLVEKFIRNSS